MTWRQTKTIEEVMVLEGPATDTVTLVVTNDSVTDGVGWTGWTWTGQVRSEDGLTLVGTFTVSDTGTTSTTLTLTATLVLEISQTLVPGLKYIGGLKGTKGGQTITWVSLDLYPQIPVVQ